MNKKMTAKPDDPAQSKRFIDAAKESGADTDGEALERALKNASKTPTPKSSSLNGA